MATKTHATIHNVKGEQLPLAWAKVLGLDYEKDADLLVDVTLKLAEQPTRQKASYDELQAIARRLQQSTDPEKILTDDDLYDDYGLPK